MIFISLLIEWSTSLSVYSSETHCPTFVTIYIVTIVHFEKDYSLGAENVHLSDFNYKYD